MKDAGESRGKGLKWTGVKQLTHDKKRWKRKTKTCIGSHLSYAKKHNKAQGLSK